ncbi:Ig-like domain-containing protein [Tenacibaculum xiamenense]|uniref:Ig-like domain-containing protein n=1 Tax=Tenacibaculum xiamenense TaxID=1261553 RepID=UPI0038963AC6
MGDNFIHWLTSFGAKNLGGYLRRLGMLVFNIADCISCFFRRSLKEQQLAFSISNGSVIRSINLKTSILVLFSILFLSLQNAFAQSVESITVNRSSINCGNEFTVRTMVYFGSGRNGVPYNFTLNVSGGNPNMSNLYVNSWSHSDQGVVNEGARISGSNSVQIWGTQGPSRINGGMEFNVRINASGTFTFSAGGRSASIYVSPTGSCGNTTPSFTSASSVTVEENHTGTVLDVNASDPNPGSGLNYQIVGGVDSGDFNINRSTGVLTFVNSPDYEMPSDSDGNNVYNVTVRVCDSYGACRNQNITVTVTDVIEVDCFNAPSENDADGDGIHDVCDLDDDNDGILDTIELKCTESSSANCTFIDTDGDGVPNHLDLDSDGDGCSDAYEAGATTNKTADFKFTGSVGNNGLVDALETSVDSGDLNYTSSYLSYALEKQINACIDTDQDGVDDIVDIDDDNDGIPDVEESDCTGSTLASDFTWHGGSVANVQATDTTLGMTGSAWGNAYSDQELSLPIHLEFTISSISNGMLGLLPVSKTETSGWNDGGYKYQLQNNNAYIRHESGNSGWQGAANGTVKTIDIDENGLVTFSIDGVVKKTYQGQVENYKITISRGSFTANNVVITSGKASLCTGDEDGDGTPNHLDLDSDADGCSDAYEAGATINTTANYKFTGPVGANGLADSLETSADSGELNYTLTYDDFALNSGLRACADTDGDGIGDLIDIDDDNDGITDVEELGCSLSQDISELTFTGNATITNQNNTLTSGSGGWRSSYSDQTFSLPIHLEFKRTSLSGSTMFGLIPTGATKTVSNWNDGGYKFYHSNGTTYGYFPSAWTFTHTSQTDELYEIDIDVNGAITVKIGGAQKASFNGTVSDYQLVISQNTPITYKDIVITADNLNGSSNNCPSVDTDNDGTPNHLDLDSDGDGCSDAYEAGATTDTTSNYKFTSAVGSNGLADVVETSADSGEINYTSFYGRYAVNSNLDACADTDGDGIGDLIDIDDDNDGVLDVEEGCNSENLIKNGDFSQGNTGFSSDYTYTSGSVGESQYRIAPYNTVIFNYNYGGSPNYPTAADPDGLIGNALFVNQGANTRMWYQTVTGLVPNEEYVFSYKIWTVRWSKWEVKVDGVQLGMYSENTIANPQWNTYEVRFTTGANQTSAEISLNNLMGTSEGHIILDDFTLKSTSGAGICLSIDTDGDGTPNHLDLDSDGDGCSDAYEAGATTDRTTDYKFTSAVGSNGLADAVETSADSGVIDYTSSYEDYAKNDGLNACVDTDGDGIGDLIDIDDDNDGVLDIEELGCSLSQDISELTFTGNATITNENNTLTSGSGGWRSSYSDQTFSLPIHFEFKRTNLSGITMFGLIPTGANKTVSNWNDQGYKFYHSNGTTYGYFPNAWTFTHTSQADELYEIDIDVNGAITVKIGGVEKASFNGTVSDYQLAISQYSPVTYKDIVITADNLSGSSNDCPLVDTDNDGTPNHLDLDSDGDGCSDAYEAGATTDTTSDYKFTSAVGSNGLADVLETSVDSGEINYVSLYEQYGTDSDLRACADTDGDGIGDLVDIDDDNDGILDIDEGVSGNSSSCVDSQNGTYYFADMKAGSEGWNKSKQVQISNGTSTLNGTITSNVDFSMQQNNASCSLSGKVSVITGLSTRGSQHQYTVTFEQPVTDMVVYFNDIAGGWAGPCGTETVRFNRNIEVIQNCGLSIGSTTATGTCSNVAAQGLVKIPGTYTSFSFTVDNSNASSCNCENYFIGVGVMGYCADNGGSEARDTDSDGIPDYLDLDSDNDGIYDVVEAGTGSMDTNNDGTIDSITSTSGDTDNDGLADSIEAINGQNTGTSPRETTTGTADYLNADSDADGCSDANEAYGNSSADGAGDTYYNPNDLAEPLTEASGAVNANGKVTAASYTTGDVAKVIDGDTDAAICGPCYDGAIKGTPTANDPDGDGINNDCDLDDDNDGIADEDENVCETPDDLPVTPGTYYWSTWNGPYQGPINGVISSGTGADINIKTEHVSGANNLHVNQMYFYCDGNQPNPSRGYSNSANVPVGASRAMAVSVNPNNSVTIKFTFENGVAVDPLIHLTSFSGGAASENVSDVVSFDKSFSVLDQCWTVKSGNSVTGASGMRTGTNEPNATLQFSGEHSSITMTISRPSAIAGDAIFFSVGTRGFKYTSGGGSGSNCTSAGNDFDQDGIPNHLDLDSDNDGIYDIVEAGTASLDSNNDGRVDNMDSTSVDIDTDKDGLADSIETTNGVDKGTVARETISGVKDYLSADSDNDGCSDANEAYNNRNADGNGDTYYNPSNLTEPLTVSSGAVNTSGKVVAASYDTGDVAKVIDGSSVNSVCHNDTFAVNDFVNTNEGQVVSGNVLANDYDLQGDSQSVKTTPVINVANGALSLSSNGNFTYTPNPNFVGEDTFTYEVCDNNSAQSCGRASVFIEVLPGRTTDNEPPIANVDTGTTKVGITLTGNVASNDFDPDGDPLTVNTTPVSNVSNGTLTLNANGSFTYVPNAGFIGPDTFTYQICDNASPTPLCDTAIVNITVTSETGNITVANDDAYHTVGDTANNNVEGNVLDNDTDPEGHTQTVNTTPVKDVSNGTLTLNADGTFDYQPNAGFFGQDSFRYTVCDNGSPQACDSGTVIIVVNKFLPPDYYPTLFTEKTIVNGNSAKIDFVVFVGEANNQNANGLNPVEVRIADSNRFSFQFDKDQTLLNGTKVDNSDWSYRKESGLHKFVYTKSGDFQGNTVSKIGVMAIFKSPASSSGKVPLKVTVKANSGGQVNTRNDNDQDIIQFSNKN